MTLSFGIRRLGALAVAFAVLALAPVAARADDKLLVVSGSTVTGFFEVLESVAQRAGFYKDVHLTVEKQYVGSAGVAAQLVASGNADAATISLEPIITGYDKGLRLQAFFSQDPEYDYALGVLDGSPIRTLADFKGTVLGEIAANSPVEISVNAMLEGAGLKKSDVTYIPIGTGAQAVAALTSGKVAGAAFPYPELTLYEALLGAKFRFFRNPILKDIPNLAFVSTPATIAAKADLLKRYVRAQVMAAIFIRENPRLAARYFVEGAGMRVTDEAVQNEARLLELSQDQLPGNDPMSMRIGEVPERGIGIYAKFMYDNGVANALVPASAVVTDQFIAYGNAFDHAALIARAKQMH
jgi:NitT/TauT family transport system substrate-binding protein